MVFMFGVKHRIANSEGIMPLERPRGRYMIILN
jgi:hypothetical protein